LGISLEGELVETLLAILRGVYFSISWSFGMVKTLIRPYLLGFVLLEIVHLQFWSLTTSFLVERSIYLASCTFINGVGFLGIHTCKKGSREGAGSEQREKERGAWSTRRI
jgi:hypothetical protein